MTAPAVPCACGPAHIGDCAGALSICLIPGTLFDATYQLRQSMNGPAVDWPVGTEAQLVFTWGTGTALIIGGTVDGSYLRFSMLSAETELVPRGAQAEVQLRYATDPPGEWRVWRRGWLSC